jgi:hypothetical protein
MGGDFNLILDKELDSMNYKNHNNPKATAEVLKLTNILNLKDIFRDNHPDLKRYTWRRKNPVKQARLDFFLISESLQHMVPSINHENSYRSDHSPVVLFCKLNEFKKGKGFWKFNNSLLGDKDYVKLIKEKILDVKKQYACLIYNLENIHRIENENLHFIINDQLFLDTLLMEIRGKTISYASFIKKKFNERESLLEKEIKELEQNNYPTCSEELSEKHKEIEKIRKHKFKGQCLRSRLKWIEDGEKPSKYFLSMESRNYVNKQIPRIVKDDCSIITSQYEILNETKLFYENLYKKRNIIETENLSKRLNLCNFPKLNDEESNSLEGPVTNSEVLCFLKRMKNDRSPGPDGFSCKFLKFFWKDIGTFLTRAINKSYDNQQFSESNKLSVITCLPKIGKDKTKDYLPHA